MVPTYDRGDHVIMSWDIALSEEEKGDYSACVVLLRRREVFVVLEVIRGRGLCRLKSRATPYPQAAIGLSDPGDEPPNRLGLNADS